MFIGIDFELDEEQREVLVDCLYYWSMETLKRLGSVILQAVGTEMAFRIGEVLEKYGGCCHPKDIVRAATTYDEEVEKLAECLERNRAILEEIAEALQIDIDAAPSADHCVEEAIELTSGKR